MTDERMTRTGQTIENAGDWIARKIDMTLTVTESNIRFAQTHGLIGIVKVFPTAVVIGMEFVLSGIMAHPVIFPSPIGLEMGNAVNRGIRLLGRIRVKVEVEE